MVAPALGEFCYQFTDTGIVLDPSTQDPAVGNLWDITEISGLDMPDVRLVENDRDGTHGGFVWAKYFRTRTIVIQGAVKVADFDEVQTFLDELALNYMPSEYDQPFYYKHPNVSQRHINCRSLGLKYVVDQAWNTRYVPFQILLIAEDPRKYDSSIIVGPVGLPSTSGGTTFPFTFPLGPITSSIDGQLQCFNAGNAEAYPVYTIVGPVNTPSITNLATGKSIRLNVLLSASDTMTINTGSRTVQINGADRNEIIDPVIKQWPLLIPGSNSVVFGANAFAAGTATATYESTWF